VCIHVCSELVNELSSERAWTHTNNRPANIKYTDLHSSNSIHNIQNRADKSPKNIRKFQLTNEFTKGKLALLIFFFLSSSGATTSIL
jgi:hypothetical protein